LRKIDRFSPVANRNSTVLVGIEITFHDAMHHTGRSSRFLANDCDHTITWFDVGGVPGDKVLQSMRPFAREVTPAVANVSV
jgi:hypothetical protein